MKRQKAYRPVYSIALVLFVTLNLLLSACGNEVTPTPVSATQAATAVQTTAAATPPANPVTITWSFWGDDSEVAINQNLIDQFEKFNPGIKVKPLHETWQNYFKKFDKDWTGNNTPDVMFLTYVSTYASQGMLENLDPYIAADKDFKMEDIYPDLLGLFRYNNSLYGLPRDNDTKVIYVNLKLLQEAGVSVPKVGWTWQDLRDAAKKLTKRDANGNITQYGFSFEPNEWWKLWVWQNGGEVYDNFNPPEPPSHLLLNTPEAAEGIQFFADLVNNDKVTPGYETMNNADEVAKLFTEGKLAMAFGNHTVVPTYSNTKGLSWDVVPLPMAKKRVNVLGGAGYSISKTSQHKAEAWKLVRFLCGELGQGFFTETGVMVPARQSVREDNIYVRNSKYNWQVFVDETKVGKLVPQFRSSDKIEEIINTDLGPVWKGEKNAAEVLALLPGKIDPLLARAKS